MEIFGNHTDYNEGFALSAAINQDIAVAIAPILAKSVTRRALDMNEAITVELPIVGPAD